MRAIRKPSRPFQLITIQPFVTGLATNLVAFAKLRHRPHSASLIRDEANPLVHCAALSPRHRLILPADRELSPIHPVYFVTYLSGLDKALTAHEKETLTAEEKCNLYCAAAALQTLVDIWDEAASLMNKLNVGAEGQLGFEFLGIEEIVTVVDVAEKAFDFYAEVELVLKNEMSSTADEKTRTHLQKDREIAATNMAAIASYGFDWRKAPMEFLEIVGPRLEAQTLRDRANALATRSVSLKLSMGLFERHPDHVVLGRNLVYMAIQRRDKEVAVAAAKKLVDLLGHQLEQTLEVKLARRKPLGEEPHLEIDDEVRSWFASERIS
ncbi:hypothetical protein ACVWW3_000320 [Bradyrhizobium sp. LM2.9]